MTRKCIVHFGFHKTGTSSIQQTLFSQSPGRDAAYVHLGSPFIGPELAAAFCEKPSLVVPSMGKVGAPRRESVRQSLRNAISGLRCHRLLISSEVLALFDEAAIDAFVQFLHSQDLSVEAVAYVRDYAPWCESFFQQSLKYGTWKKSLFPLEIGVYRRAVATFDRLLGRENVRLWKYDRGSFPGGCVVRDFYERLHLDGCRKPHVESNKGLSLDAVRLMWAFHASSLRHGCDRVSIERNARLVNHVASLGGTQVRFDPALLAERMMHDAADLDWIEERLGESIRPPVTVHSGGETIRSEADLDRFSIASLQWLERESGARVIGDDGVCEGPPTVARAMVALQDRICAVPMPFSLDPSPPNSLPKIVWIAWLQGEASAPSLVRRCIESWRTMNKDWDVRVLDGSAAAAYLDHAVVPAHRLAALPPEKRANILRMRLLTEEGGVWTDASTICLRPLDQWLPDCMTGGFFFFRDSTPFLMADNWFLASCPRNRLAELWRDEHEQFWASRDYLHHSSYPGRPAPGLPFLQRELLIHLHKIFDRTPRTTELWFHPLVRMLLRTYPYCVMHNIFNRGYRRDPEWRTLADLVPYRDAKPVLAKYVMRYDGCGRERGLDELVAAGREQGLPLLKLYEATAAVATRTPGW